MPLSHDIQFELLTRVKYDFFCHDAEKKKHRVNDWSWEFKNDYRDCWNEPLLQFSLESLLTYSFPFHDRPQSYAHRGDSTDV